MPSEAAVLPEKILYDCPRMGLDDAFAFHCAPGLDCFGHCCRDVTIVLTPYDVLRLKRAAALPSSEFLEAYTLCLGAGQKFPVRDSQDEGRRQGVPVPLRAGLRGLRDRPWACRMYPLGVAEPKNPTPTDQPFHFVIREELCQGHGSDARSRCANGSTSQGVEEFEMMSGGFKELTLHDFWEKDKPLTPQQADMFYMACYDLDRFRRFVFETRFLQLFEVDEARVEALRNDDQELLEFGMQWLRFSIFGERSMKLRQDGAAGVSNDRALPSRCW